MIESDGPIDMTDHYRAKVEAHKQREARMRNHLHVLMGNALSAATKTHTSMCLIDHWHATQANLSDAMHSNLIAAGVIRQALDDLNGRQL